MPKPTIAEAQAFATATIDIMCLMICPGYRVRNIKVVRSIKPRMDEDEELRIYSDVDLIENDDGGPSIDMRISMSGLGTKRQDWRVQILTREAHELVHAKTDKAEEAAKQAEDKFPEHVDDLLEICGKIVETVLTYCLTHDVRIESMTHNGKHANPDPA